MIGSCRSLWNFLLALALLILPLTRAGSAAEAKAAEKPAPRQAYQGSEVDQATAEWLCQLLGKDAKGQLTIAGKVYENVRKSRLPFRGKTEIQVSRLNGVIVNQEGIHPVEIGLNDRQFRVSLYTPMYDFLDDELGPDGLPGYTPHPKDEAMSTAGFRVIAEQVHKHLVELTGELPEHRRTLDDISYPSEYYRWKVGDVYVFLSAYDGNDTDGIGLTVSHEDGESDERKKRQDTDMEIFADWGPPMPHRPKAAGAEKKQAAEPSSD